MRITSRLRFPYLALAVVACVAAWSLQKMSRELHRTLEHAGTATPNGFAIVRSYGFVLYLLPIGLAYLHFHSVKVSKLREPLCMELVASAMILIYLSTSFLLITPFLPFGLELRRSHSATLDNTRPEAEATGARLTSAEVIHLARGAANDCP